MSDRIGVNDELHVGQMGPNDLNQQCGFTRWLALTCIADFHKPHRVHFDPRERLLNPSSNGCEFSLGLSPARLRLRQGDI